MELVKNFFTGVLRNKLSKIDQLYQRHAGQECYIFGNGISLKWMDLRQFADRPSILAHFMIYHKDVSVLQIPYCVAIESFLFWPFYPHEIYGKRFVRLFLGEELRRSIREYPETSFFINFSNYPFARFPNAVYTSRVYKPPFEDKNPFLERDDAHDGTFKFQISLAVFLGFKRAYLLGHDYTHSPARSLHFYEKGKGIVEEKKDFNREFVNYARRFIDLVTVTLDGGSEVMEAITYKELTGQEPRFRENLEIVDRARLENLNTFPGYSIFG